MNRRHLFRSLLGFACAPLVALVPKGKLAAVADEEAGSVRFDEPPAKGESFNYTVSVGDCNSSTWRFRIVGANGFLVR